jgi:hypothetical protein
MSFRTGAAGGDTFGSRPGVDQAAMIACTDPEAAIALVTAVLTGDRESLSAVQVVDYQVLLAELHGHTGDLKAAGSARDRAAEIVSRLDPPDPPRMLTVLAVSADLAVRAGDAGAAQTACYGYMRQCGNLPEAYADLDRLLVAGALMAVAEFHHNSCERGRDRIGKLITAAPQGPMATCCKPR